MGGQGWNSEPAPSSWWMFPEVTPSLCFHTCRMGWGVFLVIKVCTSWGGGSNETLSASDWAASMTEMCVLPSLEDSCPGSRCRQG